LIEHSGRLHFATDAWTSNNHRAFVAWTVHLQHNGEMLCFLLDVVEVPESHTGKTLAKVFQKMVTDFGIEHKVLGMVADNASANDTQTTAFAAHDNSFTEEARVRCFNHTMQLSAKAVVSPFQTAVGSGRDGDDPSEDNAEDLDVEDDEGEEEDEDEGNDPEADNGEEDVDDGHDELAELAEDAQQAVIAQTTDVRQVVVKIRRLSFAIIHSTTIALPIWFKYCVAHNLKKRKIPRDVRTRWNSTYDMLRFVQQYRAAVDAITADKTVKMRQYELDNDEWVVVDQLVAVLKQFKHATLFFSKDSASVAAVIPAMDRLTEGLDPQTKTAYHPGIIAALKLARKKMNRYYSLTDASMVYRIAMVLHPGMKLEYFRQHTWEVDWIEQAEDLVRDEYNLRYKNEAGPDQGPSASTSNDSSFFDFGNLSVPAAPRVCELDEYLRSPVENVANPLVWWQNNRFVYPNLSRMALDYLSVPGEQMSKRLA
jgi:hypothetical protein